MVHNPTERATLSICFSVKNIQLYLYRSEAFGSSMSDIWGWRILWGEGLSWALEHVGHSEHFCLYPLDASGTHLSLSSPQLGQQSVSPEVAKGPRGAEGPRWRSPAV